MRPTRRSPGGGPSSRLPAPVRRQRGPQAQRLQPVYAYDDLDHRSFRDFLNLPEMRATVDAHFSALEKSDALDGMDSFYQRAYAMISSDKARAAFSIKDEPDKLREDYGLNEAGQRMLLARRLVEAGVRFVSLTYGGWDHHDNIKTNIENQLPPFDQAFLCPTTMSS